MHLPSSFPLFAVSESRSTTTTTTTTRMSSTQPSTPSPLPILSPPLSAVLRAGALSPGTKYSPSPTIRSLRKILDTTHHSPSARLSLEKILLINYQYSLLSKKHQLLAQNSETHSRSSTVDYTSSENGVQEEALNSDQQPSSTAARIKRWFRLARTHNNTQPPTTADHEQEGPVDPPPKPIAYQTTEPISFAKPRFPLVLCHGLLGFDILGPAALGLTYFRGVREALEEKGVEVHVAKVPACASIEERAKTLAEFIETKLPGQTVNLIGHSMGGLDSRFMITHLKPTSFKVASLTTIGTPHRGSAFADYLLLDVLGRQHLSTFLQVSKSLGLPGGGQAFVELTSERMGAFNQTTSDVDGVAYFSYGAACEPSFASPFRLPWGVVYEREGPNDGLVSVASAQWGSYLGTLDNVNHAELVGWVEPWKTLTTKHINKHVSSDLQQHVGQFKVVPFYLQVVDSLAKKGF